MESSRICMLLFVLGLALASVVFAEIDPSASSLGSDVMEPSETELDTLFKNICKSLIGSDEWYTLDSGLKRKCVYAIMSSSSNQFNRERRFFALDIGKENQLSHKDNKGFKYGRK